MGRQFVRVIRSDLLILPKTKKSFASSLRSSGGDSSSGPVFFANLDDAKLHSDGDD